VFAVLLPATAYCWLRADAATGGPTTTACMSLSKIELVTGSVVMAVRLRFQRSTEEKE
jgi:hypothetical protein